MRMASAMAQCIVIGGLSAWEADGIVSWRFLRSLRIRARASPNAEWLRIFPVPDNLRT
jgi:hypothetical protein